MATKAAACQGLWLRNVLSQIIKVKLSLLVLYVDNKSAIDLAKNLIFYGRNKHIDIHYHFISNWVQIWETIIKNIRGDLQRADMHTYQTIDYSEVRADEAAYGSQETQLTSLRLMGIL